MFLGYLEGTQKSSHTLKSYQLDLQSFLNYWLKETGRSELSVEMLGKPVLDHYSNHLRSQPLKSNTRRRMLMTLRNFCEFLKVKKKLPVEFNHQLLTPQKVERIPLTFDIQGMRERIRELPHDTLILARSRALLWTLLESGCLVSECVRLRFENFVQTPEGTAVVIDSKNQRRIPVPQELWDAIAELKSLSLGKTVWVFTGFNRFGSLGSPMTSRGAELLVRHFMKHQGLKKITPRTFRHSAALRWLQSGMHQEEVQKLLGWKSGYGFKSYVQLLNQIQR